jgi:hypothetical protein
MCLQEQLAEARMERNQLESTFGMAIERCGPEFVLAVVPLNLPTPPPTPPAAASGATAAGAAAPRFDEALMASRSWLLPLLKDRVKKSTLGFFWTHLHPSLLGLHAMRQAAQQENAPVKARATPYCSPAHPTPLFFYVFIFIVFI